MGGEGRETVSVEERVSPVRGGGGSIGVPVSLFETKGFPLLPSDYLDILACGSHQPKKWGLAQLFCRTVGNGRHRQKGRGEGIVDPKKGC